MIPPQAEPAPWIVPDWPAPANVRALITTRAGGSFAGAHRAADGDSRARLQALLPQAPAWLRQVHGRAVVDAGACRPQDAPPEADASFTTRAGVVCAVLTADCLPVLLADAQGRAVAAAHAGWRGLAAGVIQDTARLLRAALGDEHAQLLAYLGPAIGPRRFEVGAEVLERMSAGLPRAGEAFVPTGAGKLHADLFALARQALAQERVLAVYGGGMCTFEDRERFFSYRREGATGRQAALVWLAQRPRGAAPQRR